MADSKLNFSRGDFSAFQSICISKIGDKEPARATEVGYLGCQASHICVDERNLPTHPFGH